MKKLIFICFIAIFLACQDKNKPTETASTTTKVATNDTVIAEAKSAKTSNTINIIEEPKVYNTTTDSINFEKYNVSIQEITTKAPLDFNSNPSAKHFKTRIIDTYKNDGIYFAGHYIGVIFGCGAGCISGFIMDVRDGKIYDLPLGEENMCFWEIDKAISQANSRLFISAICKENENSKTVYYKAYVWNEEEKIFEKTDSKNFIIAK